jgi:hypothetical protein
MTPTDVLQKLLATNKTASRFILAGLGLIAAAAVAVTWIGDNPNAILLAAYILGFAFVVSITAFIVSNPRLRSVLGWVFTGIFTLFLLGLVDSAIGLSGRLATPACYIRMFWEDPRACQARLYPAEKVPPAPAPTADVAPASAPVPDAAVPAQPGEIYLQYRAGLDRTRMIALTRALADQGWTVANGETGGEPGDPIPDQNEVRFFDAASHDAAFRLASALNAMPGTPAFVVIDLAQSGYIVPPGHIEIWVSH